MRVTPSFLVWLVLSANYCLAVEQLPTTDGQAVIDYINKTNNYKNWALWPGKGQLYKGQYPHGSFLTTYVSENALNAIENKTGLLPNGAFIVKENYTSDKQLVAVTVMYKKAGYDTEAGDWFWLKFKPSGTIEQEGKVGGCIGCHRAVKSNDWLFTGPIR